jgi:Fe-S cluster biogenesis protein NfuA
MTPPSPSIQEQSIQARVAAVLERIRPAVQADGGDVEFVSFSDGGVVQVRFRGACIGCPSSNMTLQAGIARTLKAHIPEVTAVEAVD